MKPRFIESYIEPPLINGRPLTNHTVNLSNCNYIVKQEESQPRRLFTINFVPTGVRWFYDFEGDRDRDYNRIMKKYGK